MNSKFLFVSKKRLVIPQSKLRSTSPCLLLVTRWISLVDRLKITVKFYRRSSLLSVLTTTSNCSPHTHNMHERHTQQPKNHQQPFMSKSTLLLHKLWGLCREEIYLLCCLVSFDLALSKKTGKISTRLTTCTT